MDVNGTSDCSTTIYPNYRNERIALLIHRVIYSIVFAMLAIISVVCFIRLKMRQTVTPLITTLFVTIAIFCVWRFLYIAIDPYGIDHRLHPLVDRFLADLAFPFITSSFALLIWALVQSYMPRHIDRRLFKYPWIFFVIGAHLGVVVSISILVVFTDECVMIAICHFLNATWSLVVSVSFLYILRKIIITEVETRAVLNASSPDRRPNSRIEPSSEVMRATSPCWLLMDTSAMNPKLKKLIHVSKASISLHLLIAIISSFAMGFMINPVIEVSSESQRFTIWFTYETATRLVEAGMVLTMLYLVAYKRSAPSSASTGGGTARCKSINIQSARV